MFSIPSSTVSRAQNHCIIYVGFALVASVDMCDWVRGIIVWICSSFCMIFDSILQSPASLANVAFATRKTEPVDHPIFLLRRWWGLQIEQNVSQTMVLLAGDFDIVLEKDSLDSL